MGDYLTAQFTASTDFKVGTAVRFLQRRGFEVFLRYKPSAKRRQEEAKLKRDYKEEGYTLLNDVPGYNYLQAEEERERDRIEKFVRDLVDRVP